MLSPWVSHNVIDSDSVLVGRLIKCVHTGVWACGKGHAVKRNCTRNLSVSALLVNVIFS